MTSPRARFAAARALALAALSAVALLVACEAKLPTASDVARMGTSDAEALARQAAGGATEEITYYVDGKPATAEEARAVNPDLIDKMTVGVGGSPGQKRVISIQSRRASVEATAASQAKLQSGIGDALVLIDGKRADLAAFRALAPSDIDRVSVIKTQEAVAQYGPAAASGLVLVTTTKAKATGRVVASGSGAVRLDGSGLTREKVNEILARSPAERDGGGATVSVQWTPPTIYLIDGKLSDRAGIDALPEGEIWSMMVKRDPAFVELYGPEAEKGVVQVQTKTGSPEQFRRFAKPQGGQDEVPAR